MQLLEQNLNSVRARIIEASNVLRSLNDNLSQSHMRASSASDGASRESGEVVESADGVLLRLMNNDKNITNRGTMLSMKFVDNLDRIDVCIVERRLEDAVAAHADGLQMCVMTENGPALSSMEAELRERAMKIAGIIVAAVQEQGGAAMPLLRGVRALSALGFNSRARAAFISTKSQWIEAAVGRPFLLRFLVLKFRAGTAHHAEGQHIQLRHRHHAHHVLHRRNFLRRVQAPLYDCGGHRVDPGVDRLAAAAAVPCICQDSAAIGESFADRALLQHGAAVNNRSRGVTLYSCRLLLILALALLQILRASRGQGHHLRTFIHVAVAAAFAQGA